MTDKKLRIIYALATVVLIAIEVLIALFVHDKFVRPYLGDVLVVIVLYTFVRIFIPRKVFLLPLYIFIFSVGVEVLQLFHIVEILGVENNRFLRILIGSVFDLKDIICYLIGCSILQGYLIFTRLKSKKQDK
ncbi:MAG: DUF2809 domain-containing protein [Lachnospiraceae bacterium]|nr:DUF2809 domain-containing protein [Lachnospiraceae bacterium]